MPATMCTIWYSLVKSKRIVCSVCSAMGHSDALSFSGLLPNAKQKVHLLISMKTLLQFLQCTRRTAYPAYFSSADCEVFQKMECLLWQVFHFSKYPANFFFCFFSHYLFQVLQELNMKLEQLLMLGKACSLRLYPTPQHTNHKVHLLISLLNIPRALGGKSGKDPPTIGMVQGLRLLHPLPTCRQVKDPSYKNVHLIQGTLKIYKIFLESYTCILIVLPRKALFSKVPIRTSQKSA